MTTSNERFVLDTNLIISALLFSNSPSRRAFDMALQQGRILQSSATVEELTLVLNRPKFDKYVSLQKRLRFLAAFLRDALEIEITSTIRICRDPKDDKFLELAVSGSADCIITGDKDLLTLHPYEGISILSPATFLSL